MAKTSTGTTTRSSKVLLKKDEDMYRLMGLVVCFELVMRLASASLFFLDEVSKLRDLMTTKQMNIRKFK